MISFVGVSVRPADNGSFGAQPFNLTPVASMQFGDIAIVIIQTRGTDAVVTINSAGGQNWNTEDAYSNSAQSGAIFWCRFNGTWTTNPNFSITGSSDPYTAAMIAFRPSNSSKLWGAERITYFDGGTIISPFLFEIPSRDTTHNSTVAIAGWMYTQDSTLTSFTGTDWTIAGSDQYRNLGGQDQCLGLAYHVLTQEGTTNLVSVNGNQTANLETVLMVFYEFNVEGLPFISDGTPVQFWDADCDTFNEKVDPTIHNACFCQPFECNDLIVTQFMAIGGEDEFNLKVFDEDGLELLDEDFSREDLANGDDDLSRSVFRHSFRPTDVGICNEKISLKIYNSQNELVYKSDCLDIKTTHPGTKLIEYTNGRDYAGLIYSDISPDEILYLRVPCRFFHERFPEEDSAMELSSSVLLTSSQMKSQKLMEVQHAPYYMHKKIKIALSHQSVTIDDALWQKEDAYEVNPGNNRWPLKSATCYLTEKESLIRNVI